MSVRLFKDRILVKLDPVPETKGSIILVQEPGIRTGVVQSFGPGRESPKGMRQPTGVAVGERVAFKAMNLETPQGKQIAGAIQDMGDDLALIQDRDVLFVIEGDVVPVLE